MQLPDSSLARPALQALEHELTVLRMLRMEVQQFRPGLLPDHGADGWRSNAAERYAGRLDELRLALAGAERILLDAEAGLDRLVDRLQSAEGGAWTN